MDNIKYVTVNHVVDENVQTIWERKVSIPVPDGLTPDEENEFIENYLTEHDRETVSEKNITTVNPWVESNWNYVEKVACN